MHPRTSVPPTYDARARTRTPNNTPRMFGGWSPCGTLLAGAAALKHGAAGCVPWKPHRDQNNRVVGSARGTALHQASRALARAHLHLEHISGDVASKPVRGTGQRWQVLVLVRSCAHALVCVFARVLVSSCPRERTRSCACLLVCSCARALYDHALVCLKRLCARASSDRNRSPLALLWIFGADVHTGVRASQLRSPPRETAQVPVAGSHRRRIARQPQGA